MVLKKAMVYQLSLFMGAEVVEPCFECITRATREYASDYQGIKPIYLGGSLGGYIGMELLGQHPQLFSKAVLAMCGQRVGVGRGWAAGLGLQLLSFLSSYLSASFLISGMLSQAKKNGHISQELLIEMTLRCGMFFHQNQAQIQILSESDPIVSLPLFPGKILFLNGSQDHRDSEQVWVSVCQSARLSVYEGGDHFFSHDDRYMNRFINDLVLFIRE